MPIIRALEVFWDAVGRGTPKRYVDKKGKKFLLVKASRVDAAFDDKLAAYKAGQERDTKRKSIETSMRAYVNFRNIVLDGVEYVGYRNPLLEEDIDFDNLPNTEQMKEALIECRRERSKARANSQTKKQSPKKKRKTQDQPEETPQTQESQEKHNPQDRPEESPKKTHRTKRGRKDDEEVIRAESEPEEEEEDVPAESEEEDPPTESEPEEETLPPAPSLSAAPDLDDEYMKNATNRRGALHAMCNNYEKFTVEYCGVQVSEQLPSLLEKHGLSPLVRVQNWEHI